MPVNEDGLDPQWVERMQGLDAKARDRVYALLGLRIDMAIWFKDGVDLAFAEAELRFPGFKETAEDMWMVWEGIKPLVDGPFSPLEFLEVLWLTARQAQFIKKRKMEALLLSEAALLVQ